MIKISLPPQLNEVPISQEKAIITQCRDHLTQICNPPSGKKNDNIIAQGAGLRIRAPEPGSRYRQGV